MCTDSLARSTDFAARAQAGVVKINRPTAGLDLNVPFGGVRIRPRTRSGSRVAARWTSTPGGRPLTRASDPTASVSVWEGRPIRPVGHLCMWRKAWLCCRT
ncbi:hypothetical protein [Rhodococcus sp. A14]|uniref:hypothetical protein n=1 Tax=Rhodococcus sp. A14 TaxID=1194106 RepID=UPI003217457D